MSIDSRFHDLGFGNQEIDLSSAPNDNNLLSYSNVGFGNQGTILFENENYTNTRDLGFGTLKKIEESQLQYAYRHNDYFETGSVVIDKNSYKNITLKNRLMNRANLFLTSQDNINLYYEKESLRTFKIFNSSNRKSVIDYVASQNNTFLELLSDNVISSETINDLITDSLVIKQTVTERYDESILDSKLIDALNTSGENYVTLITLGIFHFYLNSNSPTSATYTLHGLAEEEGSIFKFKTPTILNDTVYIGSRNVPIYSLTDPDDDSTRTLNLLPSPILLHNYRITLESDKSYYVWYEESENSWYVSTDRFPNINTYS